MPQVRQKIQSLLKRSLIVNLSGKIMANPVISQLGASFTKVYAWGAGSFIRHALMLDGEIGIIHKCNNGDTRMLIHGAFLRASTSLPWPLSLAQPHDIEFTVSNFSGLVLTSKRFTRAQIEDAIHIFLSGLNRDDEVMITVD